MSILVVLGSGGADGVAQAQPAPQAAELETKPSPEARPRDDKAGDKPAGDQPADGKPAPIAASAPTTISPHRAVPDYDGRGNPEANADHWGLWIPRIALAPAYFVHEYIVRRPLGALVSVAERDRWLNTLTEIFRFGSERQFMLIPTAMYDFGFRTSVGLRFSADHFLVRNHFLVLHGATGGTDWLIVSLRDRYSWNRGASSIGTQLDLVRRPDLIFRGIGPGVHDGAGLRYGLQRLEGGAWLQHKMASIQMLVATGLRRMGFRSPAEAGATETLDGAILSGAIEAPPGYNTSYNVAYQTLSVTLDTRPPRPEPGTGVRVSAYGTTGFDTGGDRSWIKYGATLGAAVDLTGRQRTLHAQLVTDFVDPMQGDVVPFPELATMESNSQMQGFTGGWMVGRSTISGELGYTWPVAFLLDASLRLSVGNAFDERLRDFAVDRLRMSADIGLTSVGARDSGFELIFGAGSSPFSDGFNIDTVRFAIGSRRGI